MAGSFGDAQSVRALGQALLSAGRGLSAATDGLSGRVQGLVPSGWSGDSADRFGSDWSAKAQQAGQLAAVCNHVGQALTALAGELDSAGQQASRARQMTGGPESRFALPSTEQQSQQMLRQASGAAQQARAAARAKLAGIAVPKIGLPLTASQVAAWADRLAPPAKPSQPWYESLWHGAESGGLGALKGLGDLVGMGPLYGDPSFGQSWTEAGQGLNDFATGFVDDGLLGTAKGLGDLVALGPLYGDPSFTSTWGGIAGLVEPWHWNTFAQSWTGLGKGLLAWDEWKTDPSRAEGQVAFNAVTLGFAGLLKLGDAGEVAADTAGAAGDLSKLTEAERIRNILKPDGNPVGVPGNRPNTRLLGGEQQVRDAWAQIRSQLRRPPDRVITTPKGTIERYDLGDGQYVQYRVFSKSGGDTIDISIHGEPIERIHIK